MSIFRLGSKGVTVKALHAGGELQVGDAYVIITAVQQDVRLGRNETNMEDCYGNVFQLTQDMWFSKFI